MPVLAFVVYGLRPLARTDDVTRKPGVEVRDAVRDAPLHTHEGRARPEESAFLQVGARPADIAGRVVFAQGGRRKWMILRIGRGCVCHTRPFSGRARAYSAL